MHEILSETAAADATFDVFLSHSSDEPEDLLLGIKGYLEDAGLTVYVDRYTDPQLSPQNVTPATAETLRGRLRASSALLYVHSRYSTRSRWMPWELGFMDGAAKRIAIVPVVQSERSTFQGEEYLGLYPYVDQARSTVQTWELWVNETPSKYALLHAWIRKKIEITAR